MNLKSCSTLAYHITHGLPLFIRMNFGNPRKTADRRLRYLVKYAYENVELYRRKYDAAGIKPGDIRSIDDLPKLPIITKKDLVEGYPDNIIAKSIKRDDCYVAGTSGSTGIPVRVYKSRDLVSLGMIASLFMNQLIGIYLGIKQRPKTLLSIFVVTPDSIEGIGPTEKRKLPAFCFKHCMDLNALDPAWKHIEALNSFKPDSVFTYPSVLRNMAVYAHQHNIELHQPMLLMVSGELLDEHTRGLITRAFKGELLNWYITTECGTIATECINHKGLHLRDTSVMLELVKNGKPVAPGEKGEVVVTDLWNEATPIIRYAGLRDVGVISHETCDCKQKTPLLKVIEGRITDSVVLSDGRLLHPFSLTLALEHLSGIASFQIIQEDLHNIKVLVVPESEGTEQLANAVKDSLSKVICNGVAVRTHFVDEIPHLSNGQCHRVVISRVAETCLK